MDLVNSYLIILCCYITATLGITTTHHDKPDESSITNMATMMTTKPELANITLTSAERAKRLLPYESFYQVQPFNRPRYQQRPADKPRNYQEHDQYQPGRVRFTPFLESNAIPGAFTPMVHPPPQSHRLPDFSVIYDDLARLKLEQNNRRPGYDGVRYFKTIQPTKTTIETFTATNIDIPSEGEKPYVLEIPQGKKPYPQSSFVIVPATDSQKDARRPLLVLQRKPSFKVPSNQARPTYRYKEPTFYHRGPLPKHEDFQKIQPASEYEHFQQKIVPLSNFLHTSNYEEFQKVQSAPRFKTFQKPPPKSSLPSPHYEVELEKIPPSQDYQTPTTYEEFQKPPPKSSLPSPHYEVELEKIPPSQEYQTPTTYEEFQKLPPKNAVPYEVDLQKIPPPPEYEDLQKTPPNNFSPNYASPSTSTQDSVPLGDLLKHLQATNTLPKTLTADNIDNSIKTLVRILEALKKRQRITKPIVVQENSSDYEEEDDVDNEAGVGISGYPGELPGTQSFPLDTEEGGTPGKPGVDYPALSSIPQTNFNCKTQRYKGFFGDPDTNCQVWHYCDLNGGQASFLCPNGTIFSQVALTCDWWFNVKCATTPQLYVLNERLYKYIIPLSPKFPEDYSGPLVDKYLALKFQEMEEKMRKEKKGKGNSMKPEEQAEEDVSGDATEKITMSESSTSSSQKETLQTIEDYNNSK